MHTHTALPRANPPLPRMCIRRHRNVRQKMPHQGSILGYLSGEPSVCALGDLATQPLLDGCADFRFAVCKGNRQRLQAERMNQT